MHIPLTGPPDHPLPRGERVIGRLSSVRVAPMISYAWSDFTSRPLRTTAVQGLAPSQ